MTGRGNVFALGTSEWHSCPVELSVVTRGVGEQYCLFL